MIPPYASEEEQGQSVGASASRPGSREPSQQVVSALWASIPRAWTDTLHILLGTRRYSLHWGTYPQTGSRHTHVGGSFVTAAEAQASAYRLGAHWYQIYDASGDEVWSSDHDVAIYRQATRDSAAPSGDRP